MDIIISNSWKPKKGAHINDSYKVGKKIGGGFNAQVFSVLDNNGATADLILKFNSGTLTARDKDLKYDWQCAMNLNKLEETFDVNPKVFNRGVFRLLRKSGKVVGLVYEKNRGDGVPARVKDPNFRDVPYLLKMLHDIFKTVDLAQRVLGFQHYDLELRNLMEANDVYVKDPTRLKELTFGIIDFGTCGFQPNGEIPWIPKKGHSTLDILTKEGYDFSVKPRFGIRKVLHPYWRFRGDCYQLLMALGARLQGRVWCLEDKVVVTALLDVIYDLTGHPVVAKFMPAAELQREKGQELAEREYKKRIHSYRRETYGLKVRVNPGKPEMTAAEVLSLPLFDFYRKNYTDGPESYSPPVPYNRYRTVKFNPVLKSMKRMFTRKPTRKPLYDPEV